MRNYEEVNGIIIGGNDPVGQLFYEGRAQGPSFNGDNDPDLQAIGEYHYNKIKEDCKAVFYSIYPNKAGWEIRMFN